MERARRSPEPIIRMVAQSRHHERLIEELHARAQLASNASRSVLLEFDPHRQHFRPTSGAGFEHLANEPWIELRDSLKVVFELFAAGYPRQVAPVSTVVPDLAMHLDTRAAILAPVVSQGHGFGVLVLGTSAVVPAHEWLDHVAECADGFALALERQHLTQQLERQRDTDALVLELTRSEGHGCDEMSLERLCAGLARVFAAERVSFWRHDRAARRVVVSAASDASQRRRPASSPTQDPDAPLVKALRGTAVELTHLPFVSGHVPVTNATVPLRGQRRALGILVLQGIRIAPGSDARLSENLTRLGHDLAGVIEGRILLDGVIEARRELELAFDSVADVVAVCDAQLRIVRVNEAGVQRWNQPRHALVGTALKDQTGAALSNWAASLPIGTPPPWPPQATDVEDPNLGGVFRVSAMPLADAAHQVTGVVLVAHDVGPERRLESERAGLGGRVEQSEALAHLAAGIAHELNNPLQAIMGQLELLRRTPSLPTRTDQALRQAYDEADRASRIVRNLLLLADTGKLPGRAISATRALSRAIDLRAAPCREMGIQLRKKLDANVPKVRGNALLLEQAFLNVLVNAEHALNDVLGASIEVRAFADSNRVVVSVRDNGPGFAPDALPHVFEPFFTTKERGSGLGLALARRIIREAGGSIDAENHPEGGAIVTVSWPVESMVK
jgi:two-component system NtrC family sensor kinase